MLFFQHIDRLSKLRDLLDKKRGDMGDGKQSMELLAAAKWALHEMCNAIAPRDSFTDAADALDAAIVKAESAVKRCQQRHSEGGQCELRAGHLGKHLAGMIMWASEGKAR